MNRIKNYILAKSGFRKWRLSKTSLANAEAKLSSIEDNCKDNNELIIKLFEELDKLFLKVGLLEDKSKTQESKTPIIRVQRFKSPLNETPKTPVSTTQVSKKKKKENINNNIDLAV